MQLMTNLVVELFAVFCAVSEFHWFDQGDWFADKLTTEGEDFD